MDYKTFSTDPTSPSLDAFTITPTDSDLAIVPRALYVGGTGSLVVTTYEGTVITITNFQAGQILPLVVKRVAAASTATGIIGII